MTDAATVRYRLSILREVIVVTLIIIALRMHIITVSIEERYALKRRQNRIRERIAELRGET